MAKDSWYSKGSRVAPTGTNPKYVAFLFIASAVVILMLGPMVVSFSKFDSCKEKFEEYRECCHGIQKFYIKPSDQVTPIAGDIPNEPQHIPGLAIATIAYTVQEEGAEVAADDKKKREADYQYFAYLHSQFLRKVAKYDGPLYLFTNEPEYHIAKGTNATLIDCRKAPPQQQRLPNNSLRAKYFKTELLSMIPNNYTYIMFTDVDLLTIAPINAFFYSILPALHQKDFVILNNPYSYKVSAKTPNSYSSAMFMIRTPLLEGISDQILLTWRKEMYEKAEIIAKDQLSLYHTLTDYPQWKDKIYVLDMNKVIYWPLTEEFDAELTKARQSATSPFMHIALSNWHKYKQQKVFDFIDDILKD